jgi:hypothetical protein
MEMKEIMRRDQINDPAKQRELREFMELVRKRLNKN